MSGEEDLKKAIELFLIRKEENSKKPRYDNASLPAGSAMFYYCRHCGQVDKKPECFNPREDPIQNPCARCKSLIELAGGKFPVIEETASAKRN